MKISLVVPVYNMVGKVEYTLDSLVNQTIVENGFAELEVIAVDDCSTDDSLAVLRSYEREHPDIIKVIPSSENHKQGGARNLGFRHATGEWIGMIDGDDWVAADFCEKLLRRAVETGADLVGCGWYIVDKQTYAVGGAVA